MAVMSEVRGMVDQLLAERRPDRYQPGVDDEWLHPVFDEIAAILPEPEVRALAAEQLVRRAEGQKTKQTNALLREIAESGQLPLGWLELQNLPMVVGKERVALRAATAKDFRDFAADERRRAATDFTTRNAACDAALWIADQMDATGIARGADLALPDQVAEE